MLPSQSTSITFCILAFYTSLHRGDPSQSLPTLPFHKANRNKLGLSNTKFLREKSIWPEWLMCLPGPISCDWDWAEL